VCSTTLRLPAALSVRPHQVTFFVRTFEPLVRNNLRFFIQHWASSSNFFVCSFICLKLFTNLHPSPIMLYFCMTVIECSSFWCVVSVFVPRRYCQRVTLQDRCSTYPASCDALRLRRFVFLSCFLWYEPCKCLSQTLKRKNNTSIQSDIVLTYNLATLSWASFYVDSRTSKLNS